MLTLTRTLAMVGAGCCWSGLGIQIAILITGPLGPVGGAWRFVAFFTILMNLMAACLFTRAACNPTFTSAMASLQTASAACMAMVGLTYVLVLEQLWDPQGPQLIADNLLHYAAPIASAVFWLLSVPKSALRWSDPLRWSGIPVIYLGYALLRARLDGFYPYFFIDVAQLGWSRVLLNAGGMLCLFLVLGLALVAIGRAMPSASKEWWT